MVCGSETFVIWELGLTVEIKILNFCSVSAEIVTEEKYVGCASAVHTGY